MGCEAFPGEESALVRTWLGGLLVRGLSLPEGLTVEQAAREREGARAAAGALAEELGGEGGDEKGLEAQVLAAQFVCAHAAAMDQQAEANRRDLPPHARATSQRLARQLMALTTSQVHALCRLRAERRKDREQAARLAREQRLAEGHETGAGRAAPRRHAPASPEVDPAAVAELARNIAATPADAPGSGGPPPAPPRPEPVGAGVPDPPAEPQPPSNRRQRRALARVRRREKPAGAK